MCFYIPERLFLHKKDNTSIDWDTNATFVWFSSQITSSLEMIHFTGDIYENHVPQHLLPF